MIYFTAHTFKCVCHCRRAMFRVLGMYNFADSRNLLKMFVNFPRICESIMFCWILPYKFCIITKDRTWPRPFRGWLKKLGIPLKKNLDYLVKLVKHENSTKQLKDHRCRVLVKIIWADRNQGREPSFFLTMG